MRRLWSYEDFVGFLDHPESLVRIWAHSKLDERFPRRYTPETAKLIDDPDEHLACVAPRYLARFKAVEFAPAILDCMLKRSGNVRSNCALALGEMDYRPALDGVLDLLSRCEDRDTYLACLNYLGRIRDERARSALLESFGSMRDGFGGEFAAVELLRHRNEADLDAVLDLFLSLPRRGYDGNRPVGTFMRALDALPFFDELDRVFQKKGDELNKSLSRVLEGSYIVSVDPSLPEEIAALRQKAYFRGSADFLLRDARRRIDARYADIGSKDYLAEMCEKDRFTLAILERLARTGSESPKSKGFGRALFAGMCACCFLILQREAYIEALSPEADEEQLLGALRNAGEEFPETIRERIANLAPVSRLRSGLTENLSTWGDIWTVRIMGRTGRADFVPDLLDVVRRSEPLEYVHEAALSGLYGIDEEGHEAILTALEEDDSIDDLGKLGLLEHLPYSAAFDFAEKLYKEERVEVDEMLAIALEGIGDERGIEVLREVYERWKEPAVGESLETLCLIYDRKIPELDSIQNAIRDEDARKRGCLLDNDRFSSEEDEAWVEGDDFEDEEYDLFSPPPPPAAPVRVEKTGRNEPCPCGSGKKYKKCCLNKK